MAQHTINDLRIMQGLPLSVKVRMTQTRIREWVREFGEDGVYVSFSGGKDSTVLLHLVRELYPGVEAVFVNTGLEFPEIQRFVKGFDNVTILTPKMSFKEVLTTYGYPFIGKDVSHAIHEVHQTTGPREKLRVYQKFDASSDYCQRWPKYSLVKWKPLLDVDFKVSDYCCNKTKKQPAKHFETASGKKPMIATMAEESVLRQTKWLQHGCNAFDNKRPRSAPLSFWTEQDVLKYIKTKSIEIAPVYGDVVVTDGDGYEYEQSLIECEYKTTGCQRTGCIFCGFGAHLDKGEGRFKRLKRTHPRQYDYCMGGGAYDTDGLWKPTKEGLGMAHCIDELCRIYGKDFIRY